MTYTTPGGNVYPMFQDTLAAPHIMIAGATGAGKSVLLNGLIYTALYRAPGNQAGGVGFIFIDNGKGTEMIDYAALPHCLRYAYTLEESIAALEYGLTLARSRFQDMRRRGLKDYDGGDVYICIDEFASLILNGKKRVSALIQDIAQLGRAAKVHIILCTQCPIAKVIPTEIKVNFDCKWALRTTNRQQSRNIMDDRGCELLPNPRVDHVAHGYFCCGSSRELYIIPMYTEDQLAERVKWWTDQKPARKPGLLRRLFGVAAAI